MDLFVYGEIGLIEKAPALAVADDDVFYVQIRQHVGGNLPGEGTLFLPVEILSAHGDAAVLQQLSRRGQVYIGHAQDDAAPLGPGQGAFQLLHKRLGLRGGFVHLPVSRNDGFPILSVHIC